MGKTYKDYDKDGYHKGNRNWKKFHPKKNREKHLKPYKEIEKDPDFRWEEKDENDKNSQTT